MENKCPFCEAIKIQENEVGIFYQCHSVTTEISTIQSWSCEQIAALRALVREMIGMLEAELEYGYQIPALDELKSRPIVKALLTLPPEESWENLMDELGNFLGLFLLCIILMMLFFLGMDWLRIGYP